MNFDVHGLGRPTPSPHSTSPGRTAAATMQAECRMAQSLRPRAMTSLTRLCAPAHLPLPLHRSRHGRVTAQRSRHALFVCSPPLTSSSCAAVTATTGYVFYHPHGTSHNAITHARRCIRATRCDAGLKTLVLRSGIMHDSCKILHDSCSLVVLGATLAASLSDQSASFWLCRCQSIVSRRARLPQRSEAEADVIL